MTADRNTALALLVSAACLLAPGCADARRAPRAVDGRIDLSGWDFSAGNVNLEGTWAACWGQLLEPGEPCPFAWRPVGVRGLWSDDSARSPFGHQGVATYRLTIDWPADAPRLSLRAGASHSAHRLFVDGVEHEGSGVVGPTPSTTSSVPRRNRIFELPEGAARTELRVQVANFDEFRGGGLRRPWLVGSAEAVHTASERGLLREAAFSAIALVVGLAYLVQFALRPRESARGYLGLFALVVWLRAIPASSWGLSQILLPGASLAGLTRVEYLGTALVIFAAGGYFRIKVPGVTPGRLMRGFQLVGLALAPIVMLAPYPLVLDTLPVYLVVPPALMGVVLLCYGRAWWRGAPGVGITFTAALLSTLGILHDVVRTAVTDFGLHIELFPYCLLVWLVAEAIELGRIFFHTFERVESLSEGLVEANFELQETESAVTRFVPFDFLSLLGRRSIREVAAGDHARARMSVLHCGFHAFDRIAERMSSEEAFRFMNALVAALEPPIYHNDGFVSQHRSDGFQALFAGGPDPALAAALGMLEAVRAFNREGATLGQPPVEVGIGIATGPLLLGTIGERRHLASGVIGDAVLTAARVEALTRNAEARLIITAGTRDGLGDTSTWRLEELPPLEPAPGSEIVVLFEVLDARDGKPTSSE